MSTTTPRAEPGAETPASELLHDAGSLRSVARRAKRTWLGAVLVFVVLDAAATPALTVALAAVVERARDHRTAGTVVAALVAAAAAAVALSAERVHTNQQNRINRVVGTELNRGLLTRAAGCPTIEHLDRAADADRVQISVATGRHVVDGAFAPMHLFAAVLRVVLFVGLLACVRLLLLVVPVVMVVSMALAHRADRSPVTTVRAALTGVLAQVPVALAYMGAVWFVALEAARGALSPGDVVLVAFAAVGLARALPPGAVAVRDMVARRRAVDRLRWFAATVPAPAPAPDERPAARAIVGGIDLVDVSFVSPGSEVAALRHVSCHLPAGATVALVGGPGSGRSTLVEILLGLRSPTGGSVRIDAMDLNELHASDWRSRTSWCGSHPFPLESSARLVVAAGSAVIDDETVVDALARVGVQTGSWPDGLDTSLGTRSTDGVELGETDWQRVALARALARPDPLLLALDEAVATSDPAAERAVYRRVCAGARPSGGVVIFVPRAAGAARDADVVVVLENGNLVECGAPDALLAASGPYARMVRAQGASLPD